MAKDKKNKPGSAAVLDFTNVKEGGSTFNKRRVPEGDYPATITKVEDAPAKSDGVMQWLFTIDVKGAGVYPYYCKHQENQLWKIRNLLVAAGVSVPKKKIKVDPSRVVGRSIGVTLEDDEYDGKEQSNIAAVMPVSELEASDPDDEDGVEDDEPKKGKKDKKGKKSKKGDSNLESLDIEDI